ncbi:MAG TPA: hypothetical protein VEH01_03450 [Nitrososphaerales archaeon]|nr:hypothetical protein [Nitrososphaerales archaeon]
MIQETGTNLYSGILRFYSLNDVRKYMKELLERYQRDYDRSSNVIGSLLRAEGGKGMEVIMSKGWAKVGAMFVDVTDPEKGGMELTFQLVTEMKPRISKTEEVLKTFESIESLPIATEATFLLYLHSGIPERLVIDTTEAKPELYNYKGDYATVQ